MMSKPGSVVVTAACTGTSLESEGFYPDHHIWSGAEADGQAADGVLSPLAHLRPDRGHGGGGVNALNES